MLAGKHSKDSFGSLHSSSSNKGNNDINSIHSTGDILRLYWSYIGVILGL